MIKKYYAIYIGIVLGLPSFLLIYQLFGYKHKDVFWFLLFVWVLFIVISQLKWSKDKFHIHSYSKPIISRYVSFNTRDIVYECRCGQRKIIHEYRPFDDPFPIKTTPFITNQDLEKIANENPNIRQH